MGIFAWRNVRFSLLATYAVNKPMMSTVVELVDEGLGEDFEDTPWVPPTVKRVSEMRARRFQPAGNTLHCMNIGGFDS